MSKPFKLFFDKMYLFQIIATLKFDFCSYFLCTFSKYNGKKEEKPTEKDIFQKLRKNPTIYSLEL